MSLRHAIFDRASSVAGACIGGWRNGLAACGVDLLPLAYHAVSDRHLAHVAHLHSYKNVAAFEADIDFLAKRFVPLDPADLPAVAGGTRALKRPAFLLTVDDGLREIRDVIAPILLAKGIPAIFFVNSAFVGNSKMFFRHKASLLVDRCLHDDEARNRAERVMQKYVPGLPVCQAILSVAHAEEARLDEAARAIVFSFDEFLEDSAPYLTIAELQALSAKGFVIGAHSRSHPHYGLLSPAAQWDETLDSLAFVKENFHPRDIFFAFPFHDLEVPQTLFAQMRDYGVRATFGTHAFRSDPQRGNIQRLFADRPDIPLATLISRKCGELMILRALGRERLVR